MSEWKAKRFWTSTDVATVDGGFNVMLDDRPLRTPAKAALVVPTEALARMVADEWDAQTEVIDPTKMPATRTANVTIDKVAHQLDEVVAHIAEYGGSDLLCYRAAAPDALVLRQSERWNPLLDWAATAFGAQLATTTGVMPVTQSNEATDALARPVSELNPFALSAFSEMVSMLGSLVLALAVAKGRLSDTEAWEISLTDEHFQREQWGDDAEALETEAKKRDAFLHAVAFFRAASASS